MKRSGFCVLLAALFLLSGCDGRSEPEKQAAEPPAAQSGSVGPAPYAETAPAYGPAEEDDNPYASYLDSGGMYLSWLYDVYEAYRGADGETRIETRNRQWLEYHIDLSAALDDGAGYWHSNEIKLPQFSGADPLAAGVNRHYREVYDSLLKEERAYQEEYAAWDGSSCIDRFGTGLVMEDEYLWNGFYQVVLSRRSIGSRVFYDPVVETFDAETGELLGLEALFAGEEEAWLPALAGLLAEEGLSRAVGGGGFGRIAEHQEPMIDFAPAQELGAEVFQSFMLTPNGLGFAFSTGLAAPMCVGELIVLVPYEAAAGILKPEILERVTE